MQSHLAGVFLLEKPVKLEVLLKAVADNIRRLEAVADSSVDVGVVVELAKECVGVVAKECVGTAFKGKIVGGLVIDVRP